MYHLDLSLRLLLPNTFHLEEDETNKKIKVYNCVTFALLLIYFTMFLVIFFIMVNVSVNAVLITHLGFRIMFLIIYMVTCFKLFRTMKLFPDSIMENEIKSIKRQSLSFLFGFTLQASYLILIIIEDEWTFPLEIFRTAVMIVSFVAPICLLIFAHK